MAQVAPFPPRIDAPGGLYSLVIDGDLLIFLRKLLVSAVMCEWFGCAGACVIHTFYC